MAQEEPDRLEGTAATRSVGFGLFTILLAAVAMFLPAVEWASAGGLVGWLLFLAGMAELAFSIGRGTELPGRAGRISGLLTALAGLIFIVNPFASFFPVTNLVMAWLLIRGVLLVAMVWKWGKSRASAWLAVSGAADLVLGALLLVGLPVRALVVSLFGPTPESVARFSLILAVSFLITGVCQLGIGLQARNRA
jgi:uncharacterized membrane protein HdeD (DUF308 family)